MKLEIKGETLDLLPQKGIYWERTSTLILSDLHLGKAGHFRKHGIPIPQEIHHADLLEIDFLIERYLPQQIIFLGDLFHSDLNAEWWVFHDWINLYPSIDFILVKGNHDIIPNRLFEEANIRVVDVLEIDPFYLTHIKELHDKLYNLSGHIHPGVRLFGAGKQAITLPCFQFCQSYGLLPAFGNFTGIAKVKPRPEDQIYVVTDDKVIRINR
jgi:DNA ligase-associated metallophosphoesterase